MVSYQIFATNNQLHDSLHQQFPDENYKVIQAQVKDKSCNICYPFTETLILPFQNFWNWFFITFPAKSYSGKTFKYFIRYSFNSVETELIEKLILSIRYTEPVHLEEVCEETLRAFSAYLYFVFDPADVDIIEPSTSLDIPFETTLVESNPSSPTHILENNSPSVTPTLQTAPSSPIFGLFPGFETFLQPKPVVVQSNIPPPIPPRPPQQNQTTMTAEIMKYLKSNLNNNAVRVEPFFGDGLQDPLTWITNFTKACKVNG